jgi:hypothetical protein
VTYSVVPLGEVVKWKDFWARVSIYLLFISVSGALCGLILSIIFYLVAFWMPFSLKLWLLTIIVAVYLIHELGLKQMKFPQIKKQIPTSWVKNSSLQNMMVWGSILGPGIFTYNPHATFFILYLYIGFFQQPEVGLLAGLIYGISRWLPTTLIAGIRNATNNKHSYKEDKLYMKKAWVHFIHAFILLIFLGFLWFEV